MTVRVPPDNAGARFRAQDVPAVRQRGFILPGIPQLALVNPALIARDPRDVRIPTSLRRLTTLVPLWHRVAIHRPCNEITLGQVAAQRLQKRPFLFFFDAFGH